jgi:hypothetical protein
MALQGRFPFHYFFFCKNGYFNDSHHFIQNIQQKTKSGGELFWNYLHQAFLCIHAITNDVHAPLSVCHTMWQLKST